MVLVFLILGCSKYWSCYSLSFVYLGYVTVLVFASLGYVTVWVSLSLDYVSVWFAVSLAYVKVWVVLGLSSELLCCVTVWDMLQSWKSPVLVICCLEYVRVWVMLTDYFEIIKNLTGKKCFPKIRLQGNLTIYAIQIPGIFSSLV